MDTSRCFTDMLQGFSLVVASWCGWQWSLLELLIKVGFRASPVLCPSLEGAVSAPSVLIQHGQELHVAAGKAKAVWLLLTYWLWKGLSRIWSYHWSCTTISLWDLLLGCLMLQGDLVEILPSPLVSLLETMFSDTTYFLMFHVVYRKFWYGKSCLMLLFLEIIEKIHISALWKTL